MPSALRDDRLGGVVTGGVDVPLPSFLQEYSFQHDCEHVLRRACQEYMLPRDCESVDSTWPTTF